MATVARKPRAVKPAHGVARLSLTINGTTYGVKPTHPDPAAASRAFRLRQPDGTVYDVVETVHGHTCDCPDWEFNREGRDPAGCKHIKALVTVGLLPTPAAVPASEPTPAIPAPIVSPERQRRFQAATAAHAPCPARHFGEGL